MKFKESRKKFKEFRSHYYSLVDKYKEKYKLNLENENLLEVNN